MSRLYALEGFKPSDLGLHDWDEYRRDPQTGREVQLEVLEFLATSDKRFRAASAPTGVGKSLVALSLAKLTGLRTAILTSTKGLQEQYKRDGEKYGLIDIRGKTNYDCAFFPNPQRPDLEANCRHGMTLGCAFTKGKGCNYERAKKAARHAEIVVANYAYWMTVNDKANGLERTDEEAEDAGENPIELLILDECHSAPDLLADYLSTPVFEREIKEWIDPDVMGDDVKEWREFAVEHVDDVNALIRTAGMEIVHLGKRVRREHVDELHRLERLLEKFERIAGMQDDWVLEKRVGTRVGRVWTFDVVWPGRYAEQYLFCNVPKVVLMSATVRPKTLGLLGIGRDDYDFQEWSRIFPPNRHPIYSIPAQHDGKEVRVEKKSTPEQLEAWVEHIDAIIDGRLDRKGIIQTVSYDRQKYLMNNSRHSRFMLGNTSDPDSDTALEVADNFRKERAPSILVSPSFSTGWDFPMDQCEYIIICKVPFKPNVGKVAKAREDKDAEYGMYLAMMEMVQSSGRGMRSAEDRCEVFVTDGHLGWFLYKYRHLAPGWFSSSVRKIAAIPKAPDKLA